MSRTLTRYRYDSDQQLRAITRPSGDSVVFGYDAVGRPASVANADATTTFAYSPVSGLLTSVTSTGGGTYSLGYDGSLPTSVTLSGGPVSGVVGYRYDQFFRQTGVAVNGDTVAMVYDKDGLLRQAGALVIAPNAAMGLPDSATLDAVRTTYRYDASGAIAGATSTANGSVVYAYDLVRDSLRRIVQRIETVNGVATDARFAYDSAGRLSAVTRDGIVAAAYTYDANGNRLTRTSGAGVESGVVDAQDRLMSYGDAQYRYTEAGELSRRIVGNDTTVYRYDASSALRSVRLPDGTQIEYLIDPLGRRVGKRVNGVSTQRFLYQSDLRIAAELSSSGEVATRFVYGLSANAPEYMVRDGRRYRFIVDQLGSVRFVVDATTGMVEQRLEYDESGRSVANTNPGFQPFGYAGGLLDDASGFLRFGARDYDPQTGRWTTKDPIGFGAGDANLYRYVFNDPVRLKDPNGKILPLAVPLIATGGLAGGAFNMAGMALRCPDASLGDLAGAFLKGAASGAVGTGVALLTGGWGAAPVLAGAAGGIAGAAMDGLLNGGSDAVTAEGLAMGAAFGGLSGGLSSGAYTKPGTFKPQPFNSPKKYGPNSKNMLKEEATGGMGSGGSGVLGNLLSGGKCDCK